LGAVVVALSCGGALLDEPAREPDPNASDGSAGASEPAPGGRGGSVGKGGSSAGNGGSVVMMPGPRPPIENPSGCGSNFIDYDCDSSMDSCPSGEHRDYRGGGCSVCVPDTSLDRSCEWGRSRYQAFLAEVTRASCADFCDDESDCYVSELTNACASSCNVALYGPIDEEIVWAADEFARESCTPFCAGSAAPACDKRSALACVDHHCVMLPDSGT